MGLNFDLTAEFLESIAPANCPVLGVPLDYSYKGLGCAGNQNSPTVDRVVPSIGYLKWNVAVVSRKANLIKQDAMPGEILAVFSWFATVVTRLKDQILATQHEGSPCAA